MPVKITDYISTTSPLDTYPTHDSNLGKGGFMTVSTVASLSNIPTDRKVIGMWVKCAQDDKVYEWNGTSFIEVYDKSKLANEYYHVQGMPNSIWSITHNLGKLPSVTIYDSTHRLVVADIKNATSTAVELHFSSATSGYAYLS